jgi:hypothetical protein
VSDRATRDEVHKIWANFANYAQYDELKVLYNKVIPEMAKHEGNMIASSREIERFAEVIARFDEVMTEKAGKMDVRALEKHVKEGYLPASAIKDIEKQNN